MGLARFLFGMMWSLSVCAHPISLTKAQVSVSTQRVIVAVTVMYEDFTFYQEARANEVGFLSKAILEKAINKHGPFLLDVLHLHDHEGKRLRGKVKQIRPMPIGEGLKVSELMAKTVAYELEYPVRNLKQLTVFQQFPGGGSLPALMDLTIEQEKFPALRPVRLTNGGNKHSFAFDWEKNSAPQHVEAHSPVAKLSVSGKTLKFSLALPLAQLESMVEIKRAHNDSLTLAERQLGERAVAKALHQGVSVSINKEPLSPLVQRISLGDGPPAKTISALSAMAHLEMEFAAAQPIKEVGVALGIFNEVIYEVPCFVEGVEDTPKVFFTSFRPQIEIKRS